jgi:hypothetical protein
MINNFYYLDWGVMLLNLYSYYLIGNKKQIGFILGLIGCIVSIFLFSYFIISIPMLIMYICFGILNYINYKKWK